MQVRLRRVAALLIAAPLVAACAEHSQRSRRDAATEPDAAAPFVLPDDIAGQACETDRDCEGGSCAGSLYLADGQEELPAAGGYCTASCINDSECGKDAECIVPSHGREGTCLAGCATDADCRDDYVCVGALAVGGQLSLLGGCHPRRRLAEVARDVVGAACASDTDCAGGTCRVDTPIGTPFPGRYCSARCTEDAQCGASGACLLDHGSAEPGHCFLRCEDDGDCAREGYRCRAIAPDFRACYPAPRALPDRTAGLPCKADSACGGGANTCFDELPFGSFSTFDVVPAPGGYCSLECALDADCGAGAQCIANSFLGGMCLANCDSEEDCRDGYRCVAHHRDADPNAMVCAPGEMEP